MCRIDCQAHILRQFRQCRIQDPKQIGKFLVEAGGATAGIDIQMPGSRVQLPAHFALQGLRVASPDSFAKKFAMHVEPLADQNEC